MNNYFETTIYVDTGTEDDVAVEVRVWVSPYIPGTFHDPPEGGTIDDVQILDDDPPEELEVAVEEYVKKYEDKIWGAYEDYQKGCEEDYAEYLYEQRKYKTWR